jgi:GNAT superfamily N-acetyltransferase
MHIQARPYRDPEDFEPMRQLVMVGRRAGIPASYMHPGCLDWATHNPPDEAANRRNLRLWERVDGYQPALAAWAIFLQNEGSFDLFMHPAVHGQPVHASVMDEYLAWAEARAREAGVKHLWPFWAMTYDTVQTRLLQARGFVVEQADPAPPLFERALDELPAVRLPHRFTVQGVRTLEDGQRRARVTHGAFQPNSDWEGYWARYAQFMRSAVYAGERDLLVRSPDGRGASACTIWLDPMNGIGLFEPVGTHPDFQAQGLGKAVMAEGLRRMQAAGMRRAVVGFDPNNQAALALYTSLGFRAESYFTVARKEVG